MKTNTNTIAVRTTPEAASIIDENAGKGASMGRHLLEVYAAFLVLAEQQGKTPSEYASELVAHSNFPMGVKWGQNADRMR